jgi:hypothetical protein
MNWKGILKEDEEREYEYEPSKRKKCSVQGCKNITTGYFCYWHKPEIEDGP